MQEKVASETAPVPETTNTSEAAAAEKPRYKGVRGWLLLFCLGCTILSPLLTIGGLLKEFADNNWQAVDLFPGLRAATQIDAVLRLAVTAFGIYAGVRLWRVRPRAVRTAKGYLLAVLAYSVVAALLPLTAAVPNRDAVLETGIGRMLATLVAFSIWLAYFTSSKRVKATYGER
jgi:hypothetical protein